MSSTPPVIQISTLWESIVTTHHPRTPCYLHPTLIPSLLSWSWALPPLVLGVSQLTTTPSPLTFSLPRLALARWATPSHLCFRWLGLQFAWAEKFSTAYCRFLHSLFYFERLPSPRRTRLPIVSMVIGLSPHPPPPVSFHCSVTPTIHSLGRHPTARSPFATHSTVEPPPVRVYCRIALSRWPISTPWVPLM